MLFESVDIGLFTVGFSLLPAAPDDADPFVGERSQGGVVTDAFVSLLVVKDA